MLLLKKLGLAGTAIVAFSVFGAGAQERPPVGRVKIATVSVRANNCHEAAQTFTTPVPFVELLDRSYAGVLDGIEAIPTEANNGHRHFNYTWVQDGKAISYTLWAKGKGHWVDPPKLFGTQFGGGWCAGGEGGSMGVEIFAHYRTE